MNKILKRIAIGLFSIIGAIVAFMVILFAATDEPEKVEPVQAAEELEFNAEEYKTLENNYIEEKQGAVISIKRDGKLFDVTMDDQWYNLENHEKERIAEQVYKDMRNIAVASELIEPRGVIDVLLLDEFGQKIAYRTLTGKWEIDGE
jgi:hypothetical protein